jgi:hypothetical protein
MNREAGLEEAVLQLIEETENGGAGGEPVAVGGGE